MLTTKSQRTLRSTKSLTTETRRHREIREGFSESLPFQSEKPEKNAENKAPQNGLIWSFI